jgi:hypothetical protein
VISRYLKAITLVLLTLVVASCAKLPAISSNQIGPEITGSETNDSLYYSPSGPSHNSSQEQIINGFMYAGNGPQDDYAVARQFLTKNYSSKWHPSTETLIQSGQATVLSNAGTKIRLKVKFDARVTSDGNYLSEPGSSRILEFRLLQEDGQWRIASAPDLTALLAPNYMVLFKAVPVYFWDKSFSYLVPDVRWFPTRASLPTKLTNALISGPTSWLAPAVQNIVPAGTKLNINSVTVDAGTASIDFNASALKVPSWKRPYLRSQLLATLGSVEGITQISISVERTIQIIGSGASGVPEDTSTLPVVLTEDGLSHIAGTSMFDIRGTKSLVQNQEATDFCISADESLVVLLGQGKIYSYNLGILKNSTLPIDDRRGLIAPSIDPFNSVWTTTSAPGSTIRITDIIGSQKSLANPFGSRTNIRSLAVSPEGSRLAILHSTTTGAEVTVFAILRDKSRKVIGFGEPYAITEFGQRVKSISWADHSTLTGLVEGNEGYQTTVQAMVGGPESIQRRTIDGLAAITVIGGNQYYLDSDGGLFVSRSIGWDRLRSAVKAIHMAGQ